MTLPVVTDTGARATLGDSRAPGLCLLRAADQLLGPAWRAYEPDTVWAELGRQGVVVPDEARETLLGAWTLLVVDTFFWDAKVYAKTCLVLSGGSANPAAFEEVPVEQLCWGTLEAKKIREAYDQVFQGFDHEPATYAAIVLQRAGFRIAPPALDFADFLLQSRSPEKPDWRPQIAAELHLVGAEGYVDSMPSDDPRTAEVARHRAVDGYLRGREVALRQALARLGGAGA